MTVLGLRAGQLIAWQLMAVAAVLALDLRGPGRWAFGASALLGFCLTVPRWRHCWAYEWILTAWRFRRGPHTSLPAIQVVPVRVRSGAEVGVVHDGEGFAVIVSATPMPGLTRITELPVARLAGLLESSDSLLTAVQVVIHSDCAASDAATGLAAAYRNLGYHRIPRSQSAWIALRHDPAVSGYATAGSPRDAQASLVRALANRGLRAVELLGGLGLRGHLMDADGARDAAGRGLLAADPGSIPAAQADGRPPHRWRHVHGSTRSHVTYALRRWPAAGIPALQRALATAPALSVTTAILLTQADAGRPGLTATVRLAIPPGSGKPEVAAVVTRAAASCGARLERLNGEHVAGVLATLPLGRGPASRGRWSHWHSTGTPGSLAAVMPITAGGVVLGADSGDHPVAVPLFAADGGIRVAIVGDPLLPRLLALRALGTGARLQVVTAQPGEWTRLRSHAGLSADCMAVVRPGTQPPSDGTRAAPWMIIDDTGSLAAAGSCPWQCVVTVPGEVPAMAGALSGLDVILLRRITPGGASAVAVALGLPASSVRPMQVVPVGTVAIAVPGSVGFVRLVLDQAERAMLAESLRAG